MLHGYIYKLRTNSTLEVKTAVSLMSIFEGKVAYGVGIVQILSDISRLHILIQVSNFKKKIMKWTLTPVILHSVANTVRHKCKA
jgi:hypothetical protein